MNKSTNTIDDAPAKTSSNLLALGLLGQIMRREPLVHFVLLAALLFLLDYLFASAQKEKILVDRQTVEFLIKQREDLALRVLSPAEREETIASFVEDEILYAEAYKRGLDKGDSRMRRNMILKMRGLLIGDVDAPTAGQLRTFFDENRERFIVPPTWSLEQVFFSDPSKVPSGLLEALRQGQDPKTAGESLFALGRSLPRMTQKNLVGIFGAEAARAILAIEDDRWYGPLESPRGAHFVRIISRDPAQEASYESVKSYLEGEWTMAQSRKAIEQEIHRLRDSYEVVIEGLEETTR